ncbi:MAG TPA: uroporphyrinogen-III synthase [Oscillatoriales cyanobacterium M59_W2019_021]|nr:MAG: uroporphyrinogen-III synthase [Cyanobacteria bacterium J055]HIK29905.1 uroporphyrinogen-III synthase [Oscillatoriales cyanobacterium M4454_W2019_049]HIK49383.1 uroporphyrinogen-III synthase [Oscillatoriales cyanobacterium M59_W2019_021]
MTPIFPLTPSTQLPLYGKRILITAPRNYAARLSDALIRYGGLPILMPTIETCILDDFTQLDTVLQRLEIFDWIAFTSRNGIDAVVRRLHDLKLQLSVLKKTQICAIGKDAERLQYLGIKVDLVPREPSPTGIITELANIASISQQKILVPVPEVVGLPEPNIVPKFVAGLERLGMEVTRVAAYQTRCLEPELYDVEIDLLDCGKIDTIAFSSTAEITAFLKLTDFQFARSSCRVACFGPYTAANAKKLGLTVDIVARDYSSFDGFAAAIARV